MPGRPLLATPKGNSLSHVSPGEFRREPAPSVASDLREEPSEGPGNLVLVLGAGRKGRLRGVSAASRRGAWTTARRPVCLWCSGVAAMPPVSVLTGSRQHCPRSLPRLCGRPFP